MDGALCGERVPADGFSGFGPSIYYPRRPPLTSLDVERDLPPMRRRLRDACPRSPGVYGMLDDQSQLIYVGMSARLGDRLLSYFRAGAEPAREARIARHARRVVWEVGGHELLVQLRELELIRRWRPRFNRMGHRYRRVFAYLCLTDEPAPRFQIATHRPPSGQRVWGPLRRGHRLHTAIERLNHVFRLRNCGTPVPVQFADSAPLPARNLQPRCLRGSLQFCSAPCAAGCSRTTYFRQIEHAAAFLDGHTPSLLADLRTAMHVHSGNREYERARDQRDAWEQLSYVAEQLQLVRDIVHGYGFVYPIRVGRHAVRWSLVSGGDVVAVTAPPRTGRAAQNLLALLEAVYGRTPRIPAEAADLDRVRLVSAWFRQHPAERGKILTPDEAMACCRQVESEAVLR